MAKKAQKIALLALSFTFVLGIVTGCQTVSTNTAADTVHVGYFPNITHAQALVGLHNNTFQTVVGDQTTIQATTFTAGPAEIEALLAGQIDLGYVGPSPVLNGYIQSNGEALRIISGAMSGGAVLVLQPDLAEQFNNQGPSVLAGKKIASPQQGNTQDIALRSYLQEHNLLEATQIVPIANADQLTMFSQQELDGAWAPEPWGSRLVQEAGGVVVIDERDLWPNKQFTTTVLIARTDFIKQHPDIVRQWVEANASVTEWIIDHPTEAKTIVNDEITRLTSKGLSSAVLDAAWERIQPTTDPLQESIATMADHAYDLGFLGKTKPDVTGLYDLYALASE